MFHLFGNSHDSIKYNCEQKFNSRSSNFVFSIELLAKKKAFDGFLCSNKKNKKPKKYLHLQ